MEADGAAHGGDDRGPHRCYLEQLADRTPGSHALHWEASRLLSGGVSSPFKGWQPFYVREAKGSRLVGIDGDEYLDPERDPRPIPDGRGSRRTSSNEVVVVPWNDIDAEAPLIREAGHNLAAVICEPAAFSNVGGVEPDREFMRSLRELTWERGILLIFDEVVTGLQISLGDATKRFTK